MKHHRRMTSNLDQNEEAGAFWSVYRDRTELRQRLRHYSFIEESCMARAMERL